MSKPCFVLMVLSRLVAKGYTQTYGVDYYETFSPTAHLNSIRVLFSLVVNLSWPMYQLDVKNAFLYGNLSPTISYGATSRICCSGEMLLRYVDLRRQFMASDKVPKLGLINLVASLGIIDFTQCKSDHFETSYNWDCHSHCVCGWHSHFRKRRLGN